VRVRYTYIYYRPRSTQLRDFYTAVGMYEKKEEEILVVDLYTTAHASFSSCTDYLVHCIYCCPFLHPEKSLHTCNIADEYQSSLGLFIYLLYFPVSLGRRGGDVVLFFG